MMLRLAWRSVWRHRRRTLITVVSIGLGLTFVVFWVSLAEGVYSQLINDAVRMQAGHVTLENPGYHAAPAIDLYVTGVSGLRARIDELPGVERTKALIDGQGIARSGSGAVGVAIVGVEPSAEADSSPLAKHLVEGSYLADGDGSLVVVGSKLAERLKLGVGKKLVLASNDVAGNLVEALFHVKGVFETGSDEIDGYMVQAPLEPIRKLYDLPEDAATQVGVILHSPDDQSAALARIRALVAGRHVAVLRWQQVLPELAAFIRLDRVSDYTFEGMLLVLVFFTIFNTLLMSVMERERETAVLLAIGTPPWPLRLQILLEAVLVAAMGCALGLALGGSLAYWVEVHGWDLSSLYSEGVTVSGLAMSTTVHSRVTAQLLGLLAALVFGATILIALVPVRRATKVSIVDVLR
jgi:putative ABC transport system permease protein